MRAPHLLLLALLLGCRASTHSGEGEIVALEPPTHVTIDHGDIPGVMGAMRMRFPVRTPEVLAGVVAGTRVRFDVVVDGEQVIVTRIVPAGDLRPGSPRPGVHDHTPHHGGVVTMVGLLHVEAVADPSGRIRVYLSDVWRKPLPPAGTTGDVALDLRDGRRPLPLLARSDALEAAGPPLPGTEVRAHVHLVREGQPPLDMHFVLPLTPTTLGAASPNAGCVPLAPPVPGGPRCAIAYPTPIAALAPAPDGAGVFVAITELGLSAWHLPDATLAVGFVIPQKPVLVGAATPHEDAATDVAVRPDGRELAALLPTRVLVYDAATGRLVRELPSPGGRLRHVAWTPDGTRLLLSTSSDPTAALVRADDGALLRRLPVDGDPAGVAVHASGAYAAIGTDAGAIVLFPLAADAAPRRLDEARDPVECLAFGGDRLWAAGGDGILRAWTVGTGALAIERRLGMRVHALAVDTAGRRIATGTQRGTILLHDPVTGDPTDTLAWHQSAVTALAWTATGLVSGDSTGQIAVWDRPPPP